MPYPIRNALKSLGIGVPGAGAPGSMYGNLEYGNKKAGSEHFVQFQARVHTGANSYLAGGVHEPDPVNLQQNLVAPRPPMATTKQFIKLYLPAQINVSQKTNFGEPELGAMVAAGAAALKNAQGDDGVLGGGLKALKETFDTSSIKAISTRIGANIAETAGATGATALADIATGRSVNNRTEMMFEGVDRRSFSFSFRLIPHNSSEADTIQQIVKSFRFHMLPHLPEGNSFGRVLVSPSTFIIKYAHENELHKISECFLESVDVKYGGERPQFYRDNRPTETEITLQFKEMEVMTKERVEAGY